MSNQESTLQDLLNLLKSTKREHISAISPFDRLKIKRELDRINQDISLENQLQISKTKK